MQHSFLAITTLVASLSITSAWARDTIYFLPEKNNLQILPQKFEYNLLNNSTIKIGDIVIDSNNLSLQFNSDRTEKMLRFTWPAGLFQEGELILFNNYGKAIKNYTVSRRDIELVVDTKEKSDTLVRNDKAIFKVHSIDENLVEEIKYLPFFKFCLQHKEQNTRIDLCSVELYLSSKDGKPTIKLRSENKKKARILVNNAKVGEQGIIFLNDLSESINLLAQSESGAKLEIETRLKPVDFKDVVVSNDGKSLLLTGRGSSPVSDQNVKKLGDDLWQIKLPIEFPVFYIQGEGGIPFRQEFFVRGVLPTESLRTYASNLVSQTYAQSEKLTLDVPRGATLSSKDGNSVLVNTRNPKKMDWLVSNLEKGVESKRIAYIKKDKDEFPIYQTFFRAPAFEAQMAMTYLSAEKINFLNLGLGYWLSNKFSQLEFKIDQAISKSTTTEKWSNLEFNFKHRLKSGLNFRDPSIYLSGHIRSTSIGDFGFTLLGIGLGTKDPVTFGFLNRFSDWSDCSIKYFVGSKSKDSEIKSLMQFDFRLYLALNDSYLLDYGLAAENFSTGNLDGLKNSQLDIRVGLTYLF